MNFRLFEKIILTKRYPVGFLTVKLFVVFCKVACNCCESVSDKPMGPLTDQPEIPILNGLLLSVQNPLLKRNKAYLKLYA